MAKGLDRVKNVYSFWGNNPLLYDAQDAITFMGRARRIRGTAAKKMKLKKGGKALEVACGTGRNFKYLEKAVGKQGSIVGFDYTREMLDAAEQLCERKRWKNVTFVQGDAAELDVGEKDFDGVLSVLGISAVPGWEQAIGRCRDVLRPGGILSICDARLFSGALKFLNPLVEDIYDKYAAWDPTKDIPGRMEEVFGNVKVENFNMGTFFIATSIKKEG